MNMLKMLLETLVKASKLCLMKNLEMDSSLVSWGHVILTGTVWYVQSSAVAA